MVEIIFVSQKLFRASRSGKEITQAAIRARSVSAMIDAALDADRLSGRTPRTKLEAFVDLMEACGG